MKRKTKKTPMKLDPNKLKSRDQLMVKLINGTTKAGVQPDRKKEENRQACRQKIKED